MTTDFQGINYGENVPSLLSHYVTLQLVSLLLSLIFTISDKSANEDLSVIQRLLNLVFIFLYKKQIKIRSWSK